MANNNSYGYGNGNKGYNNKGGSQGPYPGNQRQTPAPVLPEKVPEDYVDRAEAVIAEVMGQRPAITTSDIYNVEKLRTEKELCPDSVARVGMMRVRTAYEAGRDGATKIFVEKARLLQYLKGIGKDREDLIRFAHYMEALVAYHRYYGGKEN